MTSRVDSVPIGGTLGPTFEREVLLDECAAAVKLAYKAHGHVSYLQLAWIVLKTNLKVAADLARFEARLRGQSWSQWWRGENREDHTTNLLPWFGRKAWMKEPSPFRVDSLGKVLWESTSWRPVSWSRQKPRKKDTAYYLDAMLEMLKQLQFERRYMGPAVPPAQAEAFNATLTEAFVAMAPTGS